MSNQGYYNGPPQPAYYPPQQGQYYGPPQGQMQYQQPYPQQAPPQQVVVKEKNHGCLYACLATLCCCFVCDETCECLEDCC